MNYIDISVMDDKDLFIRFEEDCYVYHTAEEALEMLKNSGDILPSDIKNIERELKKICFKYGCNIR